MLKTRGIALILVSGILVLLALAAVMVLNLSRIAATGSGALSAAARAGFAAESGMHYAASRLARDNRRVISTPATRGDDWIRRDAKPSDPLLNPSYSHGEPWTDDGDGVFKPGEASTDLDGDGRFSAWSGRLRAGARRAGTTFSLRIESPEGRIPVNAGYLDALDRDGDGLADHRDHALPAMPAPGDSPSGGIFPPSGAPETHPLYHVGLRLALDNIGAVARPFPGPGIWTRRADVATSGGPGNEVHLSWFGHDAIYNRPLGGYRDWDHFVQVMTTAPAAPPNTGGAPYTPEELEMVRPHLDFGPYGNASEGSRVENEILWDVPDYVPVSLAAAPREVLLSLWMNLVGKTSGILLPASDSSGYPDPYTDFAQNALVSRSGGLVTFGRTFVGISWNEAERLADTAIAWRRSTPTFSWDSLYRALSSRAEEIFAEDAGDIADPDYRLAWLQAKAGLAAGAVAPDPFPFSDTDCGAMAWITGGFMRTGSDGASGVFKMANFDMCVTVQYPPSATSAYPPPILEDGIWTAAPFTSLPANTTMKAQGVTLAPPCRLEVASLGQAAAAHRTVEGQFATCERLELSSQEDFENLEGGRRLAARGITVLDGPSRERLDFRLDDEDTATSADDRAYCHVTTLPRWNRISLTTTPLDENYLGYSRNYGTICLAPRETGLTLSKIYWPFKNSDFDGKCNNDGAWVNGPEGAYLPAQQESLIGDFWHEQPQDSPQAYFPSAPARLQTDFKGKSIDLLTPLTLDKASAGLQLPTLPANPIPNPLDLTGTEFCTSGWTIEFWATTGSTFDLAFDKDTAPVFGRPPSYKKYITIETNRSDTQPATELHLDIRWVPTGTWNGTGTTRQETHASWTIQDDGTVEPPPAPLATLKLTPWQWTRHIVVSFEQTMSEGAPPLFPGQHMVRVRIFVDGTEITSDVTGAKLYHPNTPPINASAFKLPETPADFSMTNIDEVKFYDFGGAIIPPAAVAARYNKGRFVKTGTFTSPLYVFDGPVDLKHAQFSGMIPLDPGDPSKNLPDGVMTVFITGFSDAAGTVPVATVTLGSRDNPYPLDPLKQVRSLRYGVRFDCSSVPGALTDTPAFESLWFTFAGRGRTPGWTGWTGN